MQNTQLSLLGRPDTFFGVCEGIGEDFHFNANYLRIAFGVLVLFSPMAAVGIYVALGVMVAVSRWLVPKSVAATTVVVAADPVTADNDAEPLAQAA